MHASSYEGWWARIHAVLLLLIVLALSAVLAGPLRSWRSNGYLWTALKQDPSTVFLVAQILAGILSLATLYAIRLAISFSHRKRLTKDWTKLHRATFFTVLSAGNLDTDLPLGYAVLTAIACIAGVALTALWAAALAPVVTVQPCSLHSVSAAYSNSSRDIWYSQFLFKNETVTNMFQQCRAEWRGKSLLTSCPVPHLNGFLLRSAEASSAPQDDPIAKFDTSGYTHIGRSYGVGHGVGIAPNVTTESLQQGKVRSFTYLERGYHTTVECQRNTTSNIRFTQLAKRTSPTPYIYEIRGYLPNSFAGSGEEYYPISTWREPYENITAWVALHNPYDRTNYLGIAAGTDKYEMFNQTQCTFDFEPALFKVAVNVSARSFAVERDDGQTGAEKLELDPSGDLTAAVVRSVNLMSRMTSYLYVSEVGEVLLSNLHGLMAVEGATQPTDALVARATALFFTSMADNILAAFATSQILIAEDTIPFTTSSAECGAVRLGSDRYIWILLGVNATAFSAVVGLMAFHRGWSKTPTWDPRKLADVISARSSHIIRDEPVTDSDLDMSAQGSAVALRKCEIKLSLAESEAGASWWQLDISKGREYDELKGHDGRDRGVE